MTNVNGMTLAQFHESALESESKYGTDLIGLGDPLVLQDEWLSNADPVRLVDEMALRDNFTLLDDYDGDILRYWLVLGRFEHQPNEALVFMAYTLSEAVEQFSLAMKSDNDQSPFFIDLVTSCGREFPEYSQSEEI